MSDIISITINQAVIASRFSGAAIQSGGRGTGLLPRLRGDTLRSLLAMTLLIATGLLASCAPTRDLSVAPQGDQSIVLWHRASGERIDVTTRSQGRYDSSAFQQIDHIFRDRHTGEEYPIDPKLIDAIAELRDKLLMSPSDPIELLSGYRSSESNAKLATINKYVAKNSYHMKGQAADIRIPDMSSSALEAVAKTMQKGGVALYPDGGPDFGHVHVDTGPVRGWSVIHGREAGLRESHVRSNNVSSGTSSSSATPFNAPRNRHNVIEPKIGKPIRVKPLNSYDDLPEPASAPKALPKPAPKPSATVKSKTGSPAHIAPKAPAKTPAHNPLDTAKKQWVKTPFHGKVPTHTGKAPVTKKPPVKHKKTD
ncbi:MAG: DUF882 domain-containing protein [Alphaproteobacteria bacterium]|nr:DUF882 domain-containing protein [Alphaproteobacteria bacterium]